MDADRASSGLDDVCAGPLRNIFVIQLANCHVWNARQPLTFHICFRSDIKQLELEDIQCTLNFMSLHQGKATRRSKVVSGSADSGFQINSFADHGEDPLSGNWQARNDAV